MARFLTVQEAAESILAGRIVAFPTETVYGLGANALNLTAIERLYQIKGRPKNNPLICHLADPESVFQYGRESGMARRLARFWPGPLTVLLEHEGRIPSIVTAGSGLAGFRIPNHPIALEILRLVGKPVAAPSANLSNSRSPVTAEMVYQQIGDRIDGIVDGGRCEIGVESTVVKIMEDGIAILRPGAITAEMFEAASISVRTVSRTGSEAPESPGMQEKHYAPSIPMILIVEEGGSPGSEAVRDSAGQVRKGKSGLITFAGRIPRIEGGDFDQIYDLSPDGDLDEAAKNLFYVFGRVESDGLDEVYALPVPEMGIGRAVNDRLRRAASYRTLLKDGRITPIQID